MASRSRPSSRSRQPSPISSARRFRGSEEDGPVLGSDGTAIHDNRIALITGGKPVEDDHFSYMYPIEALYSLAPAASGIGLAAAKKFAR